MGLLIPCECQRAEAGAGGRMWLEASRLARGDCAELENPFPPPTPGARSLQRQQKCFLSIPSLILDKRGQARLYICLGAGAGAILTHMRIMCIELHPSRVISKIHIRKGCALCRRPLKKIDFEFKFTIKLKLEFDFDFDLISGSNFNKMGVKVVQISTYHFQI